MPRSEIACPAGLAELVSSTASLLRDTVALLVRSPRLVTVEAQTSPDSVTFLLKVAREDFGIVIGRDGRTARSLRVLLQSLSTRSALPFNLDIQHLDS